MKILTCCLFVLSLITFLNACSSYLPTEYYLIQVEPAPLPALEPLNLTVNVGEVRAPLRYQNPIISRPGRYEVTKHEYSRWAALPAKMVRRALIDSLGASGLFRRVELIEESPRSDLYLLAEIESFDQLAEGDNLSAEFSLIIEAIRPGIAATVWSQRVSAVVPHQAGKGELAAAMSAAVSQALGQAIEEMGSSPQLRALAEGEPPAE